ncbi:23S rRNA (uracil(1939)-C(5))-methyltransferase RlmD [Cytophagaceae bacterium ABcell3]|nr:23S rRNA (uracil(1939)-C(5))-methyltransferase RlmD [Cytophagaceae bacterium ABcell3]
MAKKKKQPFTLENIQVIDIAAEGKSIAKHENKVIFVDHAAPGDIVDLYVYRTKRDFAFAKPIKFHQYSPLRQEPFCQHFGTCGGCKWQHLNYKEQLKAKTQQVKDSLDRIAKVTYPEILPILGSQATQYYRNKLEYTFSDTKWLTDEEIQSGEEFQRNGLGFHIPQKFDKILDIEKCYLQPDPSNEIRNALRDYAIKNDVPFFNIRNQEGWLRNLIIRTANTGEVMVILQVYYEAPDLMKGAMEFLKDKFPQVTSLNYVINPKGNETFHDLDIINYHGLPYITETMEGLKFRIGSKSFYQTNSEQAYTLYKVTRDFAGLSGNEVVYDLYTGTGTIANFVSGMAKKVAGIEYVEMAIEDAKVNSKINGITNTYFEAGDMKDVLNERFIEKNGTPDVVITDPPRAGMHKDVVNMLLRLKAAKIVYVSCNPATQARDLALLDEKYNVTKVQPVDMFPHTQHIENVVLLELKQ